MARLIGLVYNWWTPYARLAHPDHHHEALKNRANLATAFFSAISNQYEGTRLGRQELDAEILDDVPSALWQRDWIDRDRVAAAPADLKRIVIAIDPAVSSGEGSNETGIVVVGLGRDGHCYVLDDLSGRLARSIDSAIYCIYSPSSH